jgi:hypothetical protein
METDEKISNLDSFIQVNKDIDNERFKQFLTNYEDYSIKHKIALNYLIETSPKCDLDILLDIIDYVFDIKDDEKLANVLTLFEYNRDEETIITDDKYLYLDLVSPFHNQRYEKMLVREDKDLKSKINQYFNKLLEDNIKYSMFDAKGPGFNI